MADMTLAEKMAALNPGDEVEITDVWDDNPVVHIGVLVRRDGDLCLGLNVIRWRDGRINKYVTDVRVIKPVCPFPMGAKVRGKRSDAFNIDMLRGTVAKWQDRSAPGSEPYWRVGVEWENGTFTWHAPYGLELVPEPERGICHVCDKPIANFDGKWLHYYENDHGDLIREKRYPFPGFDHDATPSRPEPERGSRIVWWKGEWWIGMEQYAMAGTVDHIRWFPAGDVGANNWVRWNTMRGAVVAVPPREA
jgi:hypothetical protein